MTLHAPKIESSGKGFAEVLTALAGVSGASRPGYAVLFQFVSGGPTQQFFAPRTSIDVTGYFYVSAAAGPLITISKTGLTSSQVLGLAAGVYTGDLIYFDVSGSASPRFQSIGKVTVIGADADEDSENVQTVVRRSEKLYVTVSSNVPSTQQIIIYYQLH